MSQNSAPVRSQLQTIARRAMVDRGLLPDYSPAVLEEAARITSPGTLAGVTDLRELPWASIDNDDSRDLDQLSVAQPGSDGATRILVAIADVDALVKKGSAIDGHARANTTTVYTAADIFSMLPEKLSTDLTSFGEGEPRLAIVVDMEIAPDGALIRSDVYQALVLNHAKLAYGEVATWLEDGAPEPARLAAVPGLDTQLRTQDRIAQALREVRHRDGALGLRTSKSRAVFEGDKLADLRAEEQNRAMELIEDFMIAANGVTARYLEQRGSPSIRRVLKDPERWEAIVKLAAGLRAKLPAQPSAVALDEFLRQTRRDAPERFADISLSVVKLLGRGEYALEVPGRVGSGHFGLAVKDYAHSTAPNRRFPDVITQRLLKAALAGQPVPYSNDELHQLAKHCTAQEDNATKVERQVRKSAAALLLQGRIGETFDAIVTGASPKGTWVRITHPAAEGRIVRGSEGLDVGDRLKVKLVQTNVGRGFVDFAV